MTEKDRNSLLSSSWTVIAIIILAITQVPSTIKESIHLLCILTSRTDYSSVWSWNEIPLDARVRYCNGSNINTLN